MAAIAGVALVGCNKNVDDELTPSESKSVVTVKQTIVISLSEDLRNIADVELSAHDLKGEEVVVMGALYSEKLEEAVDFNIDELAFPCSAKVAYQLAPKSDFTPTIGQEYNLARTVKVTVELLNEKGKVLATKSDTHERTTAKVVAKENTDWTTLLGGSGDAEVKIEKEADGSYELED